MTTKSIESEQGILGAVLLDESKMIDVMASLAPDDFSQEVNRVIYQAMLDVNEKGQSIDFITVLEEANNPSIRDYMAELIRQTGTIKGLNSYIDRVLKTSTSRKLMAAASEMIRLAQSEEPKIALELSQDLLTDIGGQSTKGDPKHVKEVLGGYIDTLEERDNLKGKINGLETGFKVYDERLQGIKPTDLVVIAARPSMGKTTFALNIIENAIYRLKKPALIFSMEMSSEQLSEKLVASLGNIHLNDLKTAKVLHGDDGGKLVHTVSNLNDSQLYIDDSPGLTISEVTAKSHKINRKVGGLSAIMIDYIGLMEDHSAGDNTNLKVTRITAGLKRLAKTLKVPVIALSQLNRGVETRNDKRPVMSDLRDSGSIEQDADIITFLYRDEYYNKEMSQFPGITEVITGKFRMGETGTDALGFEGHKSRFTNLTYTPDMTPKQQTTKRGLDY